ncbi:hypothetical protein [Prosthecobacter vanneervenii]|uniref:Uncharacterized protein n=1 Tax=Prosthecobacter vanneervenii TaxID=48466 RepID=A0A7W8DKP7_9BACT|nr:hypothetical protein [Prosthecobacter vanneervenii]MBB5033484.1 hypothetical protein [Prosthecobacter vanneervenii]
MTTEDESELHRLCDLLRIVDKRIGDEPLLSAAVKKAALGLSIAFIHGFRAKVEDLAQNLGRELSDADKEHLRSCGIDLDAPLPTGTQN